MTEVLEAFQQWKKKWNKNYDSAKEENIRFEDFTNNFHDEIKYSDNPPETKPLWDVLNKYADRPLKEHFGYIRLDRRAGEEEGFLPEGVTSGYMFPVKLKDGAIAMRWGTSPDDMRKLQSEADDTVLPVKRPSSGAAKIKDVAMTLENEGS